MKAKKTFLLIEHVLIFIGFAAGLILLLESIASNLKNPDQTGLRIFLFSVFLWFVSFLSRKYIFKTIREIVLWQKMKIELVYFLFCYTFTNLFVTTILTYTPLSYSVGYYESREYSTYSGLLNYLTKDFAFLFLINVLFVVLFFGFLIGVSKYLYKFTLDSSNYVSGDVNKMSILRVLSIAFVVILAFAVMQVPMVSNVVSGLNSVVNEYLRANFQWAIDYVFGSPVVYYAYVSFKGSELVEEFSLYNRLL